MKAKRFLIPFLAAFIVGTVVLYMVFFFKFREKKNDYPTGKRAVPEGAHNIAVRVIGDHEFEVGVNIEEDTLVDTIWIGDPVSEAAHNLEAKDAIRGKNKYGESYIKMNGAYGMKFTIAIDPVKYNYITVKFWGGEFNSNYQAMQLEGENSFLRNQDYTSEWPLIDYLNAEPEQEGTYYYSTYRLPLNMTFGKTKVELTLRNYGPVTAYSEQKIHPTSEYSREIYMIASHTDPAYVIQKKESVGVAGAVNVGTSYRIVDNLPAFDYIEREVNNCIYKILGWQCYGEKFEAALAAGKTVEMARGSLMKGCSPDTEMTLESFYSKYWSTTLSGNAENIKYLYGLAAAYLIESNDYYHNDEILDRLCAALDFYYRAQGSNGGFSNTNTKTWIGISDNRGEGYDAQGRYPAYTIISAGERSIAESFCLLYEYLKEKGYLDELIDHDYDPSTPKIPRREAYLEMFIKGANFAFYITPRRECVNQDQLNLSMGYWFNEAVKLLDPSKAIPDDEVMNFLYEANGIIEHFHGGYQFSSKLALSLEPFGSGAGGYCGNYGFGGASNLYDFAYATGDEKLIEKAVTAAEGLSYFLDYVNSSAGIAVLRKEEVINTRNTFMPGRIAFAAGGYNFLPILWGSECSLRQLEIFLNSGYYYVIDVGSSADQLRHFINLITILKDYWKPASDANKGKDVSEFSYDLGTDYVLPFEKEHEDFVVADEMARCVVIKHNDTMLRMTLNWRNSYKGSRLYENASVNNVARVHHTTKNAAYVSTFYMLSPFGFGGPYVAKYGEYTVIMNSSLTDKYTVKIIGDAEGRAMNLATGELIKFHTPITMEPLTTIVIYTPREKIEYKQLELVDDKTPAPGKSEAENTEPVSMITGTEELLPIVDTYVRKGDYAGTSYGNDHNLVLGKDREAYIMFDISRIPDNATSIKLQLYSWWGPTNPFKISLVDVNDLDFTGNITYATRPRTSKVLFDAYIIKSESNKKVAHLTEIDLTNIILEYKKENPTVKRFALHFANPDVTYCTEIRSSRNGNDPEGDSTLGPRLIVIAP